METCKSTSEYFTDEARAFRRQYDTDPAFRERFDVWSRKINELAPGAKSVVDVGCGPGMFALHYARKGLRVVGIDASAGMVRYCEEQRVKEGIAHASFMEDRLPRLAGYQGEPADLVLCSSVLEYVGEIEESLVRLRSLTKPDGLLLVSLPNARSPYRALEVLGYRLLGRPRYIRYVLHRLSAKALSSLAASVGLETVSCVHYAHGDPLSAVLRAVGVPVRFTGNLLLMALCHAGH